MGGPVTERSERPPLDREYDELVTSGNLVLLRTIRPTDVAQLRQEFASPPIEQLIGDRPIRHEDFVVPESGMPVSVLTPVDAAIRGWVFAVHGGGLIVGDRYTGIEFVFDWIEQLGLAVVTPEYRLAPEHPYPAALTDCDHALAWARAHFAASGSSSLPLVLSGVSAGGALATALALTLRDRGEHALSALLLQAPMLDHRNESVSSRQFSGTGQWDRESNDTGWGAYLASSPTEVVTPYMSPALATDLTGLPPTFIDVGSAELFRDEDVAFASALWAAGVEAQLVVWPGGVHGFDRVAPATTLARGARTVRNEWLARVIESA
ncbi:alpha/beta hydrolase [soil metagenome]